MPSISKHSKERIIERIKEVSNFSEAKKLAKQARTSGKTINYFQKYPRFFSYLQNKRDQTNDCSVRVYQGYIYIWRGKNKTLVTVHPIPNRYIEEINKKDSEANNASMASKINSIT